MATRARSRLSFLSRIHPKSFALDLVLPLFFLAAEDVTDLLSEGPIAVIAPHQDDDILSCGATIARARRAGVAVKIYFISDGSKSSVSDIISPGQLSAMRRVEAVEALQVLGGGPDDVVFLDIPDNSLAEHLTRVESMLAEHLSTFRPALVFSPYGIDPHPDHVAAAIAVERLISTGVITGRVFEYPRFQAKTAVAHLFDGRLRRRLRRVNAGTLLPLKRSAISKHRSQCERLTDEPGWNVLEPHWTRMFFKHFELYVEKR